MTGFTRHHSRECICWSKSAGRRFTGDVNGFYQPTHCSSHPSAPASGGLWSGYSVDATLATLQDPCKAGSSGETHNKVTPGCGGRTDRPLRPPLRVPPPRHGSTMASSFSFFPVIYVDIFCATTAINCRTVRREASVPIVLNLGRLRTQRRKTPGKLEKSAANFRCFLYAIIPNIAVAGSFTIQKRWNVGVSKSSFRIVCFGRGCEDEPLFRIASSLGELRRGAVARNWGGHVTKSEQNYYYYYPWDSSNQAYVLNL